MSNDALKTQDSLRVTRLSSQRGAAYLEFAMVLPFFLVFVMGIVEFGRGFNIYHNLTNGCREGARYAATPDSGRVDTWQSADATRDRVVSYLNSLGVDTSYFSAKKATNPSGSNWVYGDYPSGEYLLINKMDAVPQRDASGNVVVGGKYYQVSKVEIRYPYTFPTFSKVIRLMVPTSAFDGTVYITNSSTMENE